MAKLLVVKSKLDVTPVGGILPFLFISFQELLPVPDDLEIKVNVAHAILKTSKREQKFMPMFTLLKGAE